MTDHISGASTTVHVENLIKTIVRAFYPDECVCIIDVLLRDKYLRDDDMGPRLSLPVKQLRRTMEYLHQEMLVKYELVDDLAAGGSQQTKFWYVDYNHCVNVIRWRVFKLKKEMEKVELLARSSSMYVCPNYSKKICNGTYSELEAQQILDYDTGLFLCQECVKQFSNHPEPPPKSSYTLDVVDSSKDLKAAMENMKRINEQFSGRRIGNFQLRYGVYDLLQKIRKSKGPLSSNLPSENFALGIGSTRLEGTGRTAGIKAKKLAQQQGAVGLKAFQERKNREVEGSSDLFKNAMGEEVSFILVKGSGKRAFSLASKPFQGGIIDSDHASVVARRIEMICARRPSTRKKVKTNSHALKNAVNGMPHFLLNNINRTQEEIDQGKVYINYEGGTDNINDDEDEDDSRIIRDLATFQDRYSREFARQKTLLFTPDAVVVSDNNNDDDDDSSNNFECTWEDG